MCGVPARFEGDPGSGPRERSRTFYTLGTTRGGEARARACVSERGRGRGGKRILMNCQTRTRRSKRSPLVESQACPTQALRLVSKRRCRANLAHIRQSRPDSGLGFRLTVRKPFQLASSSLASGTQGSWNLGFPLTGSGTATHTSDAARLRRRNSNFAEITFSRRFTFVGSEGACVPDILQSSVWRRQARIGKNGDLSQTISEFKNLNRVTILLFNIYLTYFFIYTYPFFCTDVYKAPHALGVAGAWQRRTHDRILTCTSTPAWQPLPTWVPRS